MLIFSVGLCFLENLVALSVYAIYFVLLIFSLFYFDLSKNVKSLRKLISLTLKVSFPIYILALFSFLSNTFIWADGAFHFQEERFYVGLFFSLRLVLLVWLSLIIANTISFTEFSDLFDWVLKPLKFIKVPVKDLSLTATLALRFIPETYQEFDAIRSSAWARGARLDYGTLTQRTKSYTSCLLPLFIRMVKRSQDLNDALIVRCWGIEDSNDKIFGSLSKIEVLGLIVSLVVLIGTCLYL